MSVVFLNLLQISQPLNAILSISHRISGVFMILLMPVWSYLLYQLKNLSANDFQVFCQNPYVYIILILSTMAMLWHALLGIRHMLDDMGLLPQKYRNATGCVMIALYLLLLGVCV